MILTDSFVDSNILLYLFDTDGAKKERTETIIANSPCLNSQVLVEVANVCRRKFGYSKTEIKRIWLDLMLDCHCVGIDENTMKYAIELMNRYDFQLFDSIIIASAVESKCSVLFSEDMQDGMLVEKVLTIVNPFL